MNKSFQTAFFLLFAGRIMETSHMVVTWSFTSIRVFGFHKPYSPHHLLLCQGMINFLSMGNTHINLLAAGVCGWVHVKAYFTCVEPDLCSVNYIQDTDYLVFRWWMYSLNFNVKLLYFAIYKFQNLAFFPNSLLIFFLFLIFDDIIHLLLFLFLPKFTNCSVSFSCF